MDEAGKVVEVYQKKYGSRVEKILSEVLGEMKSKMDGDGLFCLHTQLETACGIIREMIKNGAFYSAAG